VQHDRFHGRREAQGRLCGWPACDEPGEFRAPGQRAPGFDGPGEWRWFCLEHVRAFNAGYDYFAGMSAEEISAAQSPIHGWERETRAFSPTAGVDDMPRWADFADPLEAISARAREKVRARMPSARQDGRLITAEERRAFDALGLSLDADRRALRTRYSDLVRRYHPDRNGGDRSYEVRLQAVVEAYQLLRRSQVFA
jgi:DnaJ domain